MRDSNKDRLIHYADMQDIPVSDFLPLLNDQTVRKHLVDHPRFDETSASAWIAEKNRVNASPGCRVKAVLINGYLAGWCGIQREGERFEIAIVLHPDFWGAGKELFSTLLLWARDLGHNTIDIHFPESRRDYRFLRKLAKRVHHNELMGATFVTYEIEVP